MTNFGRTNQTHKVHLQRPLEVIVGVGRENKVGGWWVVGERKRVLLRWGCAEALNAASHRQATASSHVHQDGQGLGFGLDHPNTRLRNVQSRSTCNQPHPSPAYDYLFLTHLLPSNSVNPIATVHGLPHSISLLIALFHTSTRHHELRFVGTYH